MVSLRSDGPRIKSVPFFKAAQSNNTQPSDDISAVLKPSPWRSKYLTITSSVALAATAGLALPLWAGSLTHLSGVSAILAGVGLVILALR